MTTLTHTAKPHRLNPAALLGIYSIIPAVLLFIAIDYWATNLQWSRSLDVTPQTTLLIGLLFQSPHAFASVLSFIDTEYIHAYKRQLILGVLIALGGMSLAVLFNNAALTLFLVIYTFYHQSSQQAGISAMLSRHKSWQHEVWRWMSFVIFFIGLMGVFIKTNPSDLYFSQPHIKLMMSVIAALFLLFYTAIGIVVARKSTTKIGRAYVLANTAMLLAYAGFFSVNFFLYMILIPVFIHDMTAFAFYINHNTNRNAETKHNFISRLRNKITVPEFVLTPLAGFLCGAVFLLGLDKSLYAYIAITVNVMHFYLEGVMWKHGALHRQHIAL